MIGVYFSFIKTSKQKFLIRKEFCCRMIWRAWFLLYCGTDCHIQFMGPRVPTLTCIKSQKEKELRK
jgi:hypothetical protein